MTHDKTGGPAFPAQPKYEHPGGGWIEHTQGGMTLRDYFAGQALVGEIATCAGEALEIEEGESAHDALNRFWGDRAKFYYLVADAMLREREDTTND